MPTPYHYFDGNCCAETDKFLVTSELTRGLVRQFGSTFSLRRNNYQRSTVGLCCKYVCYKSCLNVLVPTS
uniref:Uncharacterized protein n=1 Tax=Physcomitrium patens TaxID=3218 RepID=A0A2K1KPD2_PHYPA|nr:hypothetical protein PHYPA_006535 [Physcomitrium patens]